MLTHATTPSPTMSDAAVDAVRFGLRIAFCWPSFPGTPRLRSGAPSRLAAGRTMIAAKTATPRKVTTAPAPTSWSPLEKCPKSPSTSRAAPLHPRTRLASTRSREAA